MFRTFYLVLVLTAFAACTSAFAADSVGCGTWMNMFGGGSFPTALAACKSTHEAVDWADEYAPGVANCRTNSGGTMGQVLRRAVCTNQCAEKSGEISTTNITRGWARSPLPNKADQLGKTSDVPQHVCSGGCKFSVLGNEEAYRSQTPSDQGLYRLSSDVTVIQTDQSCDGESDMTSANPSTPDMPCPGQLGELNGKPYCAIGPGNTGVDPNGAPGTGKSTDDKGNPKAGPKPKEGEGSGTGGVGRTPSEGNGGNMGGPGGAAAGGTGTKPGGTAPDGTTEKKEGKEQENCGAPGQKPCKIDEKDTPTGEGKFEKLNGEADQGKENWLAEIKKSKDLNWGDWTWTFQLPSGCTPLNLPELRVDVDVCRWQPMIHSIMSMVWAISTVMGCVYLVFRAQGGH